MCDSNNLYYRPQPKLFSDKTDEEVKAGKEHELHMLGEKTIITPERPEAHQTVGGDKTYTTDTERNKKFWAQVDKNAETDMWRPIDQKYQRVTKCDGTVILTPRAKSDEPDNLEEASEANLPWVSPGPSESEIAEQADRVRRADIWVETNVWEKSDRPLDSDGTYTEDDQGNWSKVGETDIADEDDKAELVREADEQHEIDEQRKTDNDDK